MRACSYVGCRCHYCSNLFISIWTFSHLCNVALTSIVAVSAAAAAAAAAAWSLAAFAAQQITILPFSVGVYQHCCSILHLSQCGIWWADYGHNHYHFIGASLRPPSHWRIPCRGVVGRRRGGTASPTFLTGGTRSPLPPLFWTEIRAKVSPLLQLVTYWNAV